MSLFGIDYLIYIVINLLGVYLKMKFVSLILGERVVSTKIEVFTFAAFYLVNTSLFLMLDQPMVNLAVNLVFLFLTAFLYEGKLVARLIAPILAYSVGMLIEGGAHFALESIAKQTHLDNISYIATTIIKFMLILVLERLVKRKTDRRISVVHWIAAFLIPVGSIVIAIVSFSTSTDNFAAVISLSILLVINLLAFYIYNVVSSYYGDKYEKALLIQQNNAYANHLAMIKETQDSFKIMRHDMKNHIGVLRNLAQKGESEEIIAYIDTALDAVESHAEEDSVETGNPELDSVLNYKLMEIKKTAEVLLNINVPTKLKIEMFDLNSIIGNLLDNAVAALEQAKEKIIKVSISLDKSILYITVKNSYGGRLAFKNGRPVTTKKDKLNHGLGLKSVENAIKSYNGSMEFLHDESFFTVNIVLYIT